MNRKTFSNKPYFAKSPGYKNVVFNDLSRNYSLRKYSLRIVHTIVSYGLTKITFIIYCPTFKTK